MSNNINPNTTHPTIGGPNFTSNMDQAVQRIQRQPQHIAILALKILSFLAEMALSKYSDQLDITAQQLAVAVTVKQSEFSLNEADLPDISIFVDICAGLVAINESTNIIGLVDPRIPEFLVQYGCLSHNAALEIAMACTTYLSYDMFNEWCMTEKELASRHQSYPFLLYAASNIRNVLSVCDEKLTTEFVLQYLARPDNFDTYQQARDSLVASTPTWDNFKDSPQNRTQFQMATLLGHFESVKIHTRIHINSGDHIDTTDTIGRTALHDSVNQENVTICEFLLEQGADPSCWDHHAITPLHEAVVYGHRKKVRLLLEKGADVLLQDEFGRYPLHEALIYGGKDPGIAQMILDTPAYTDGSDNISWPDNVGWTALHIAAREGYEELGMMLLELGASYIVGDDTGWTALHAAASMARGGFIKLLLETGADPQAVEISGLTPLGLATQLGVVSEIPEELVAAMSNY